MIRLHHTDKILQAFLAGAAATTNPTVTVGFYDVPNKEKPDNSEYRGSVQYTVLAGTTETEICAAPAIAGTVRNIDYISIYNTDTAPVTVTVCIDDAGTNRIQAQMTLASTESGIWSSNSGDWQVVT
jgi:hypothetical protein